MIARVAMTALVVACGSEPTPAPAPVPTPVTDAAIVDSIAIAIDAAPPSCLRGIKMDAPQVRGRDWRDVRSLVKRTSHDLLVECREAALRADPTLAGSHVTTTFRIDAKGKVHDVTATGIHASVETCVKATLAAIAFPSGAPAKVQYGLHYAPPCPP